MPPANDPGDVDVEDEFSAAAETFGLIMWRNYDFRFYCCFEVLISVDHQFVRLFAIHFFGFMKMAQSLRTVGAIPKSRPTCQRMPLDCNYALVN